MQVGPLSAGARARSNKVPPALTPGKLDKDFARSVPSHHRETTIHFSRSVLATFLPLKSALLLIALSWPLLVGCESPLRDMALLGLC
jgi:hypothetical protein